MIISFSSVDSLKRVELASALGCRSITLPFNYLRGMKKNLAELKDLLINFEYVFIESGVENLLKRQPNSSTVSSYIKDYSKMVGYLKDKLSFAMAPLVDNIDAYIDDLKKAEVPIYMPIEGYKDIENYVDYPGVYVYGSTFKDMDEGAKNIMFQTAKSKGALIHGRGITDFSSVLSFKFNSLDTGVWTYSTRYGTMFKVSGLNVKTVKAKDKDAFIKSNKGYFESKDISMEALLDGDTHELDKLALIEFMALAEKLDKKDSKELVGGSKEGGKEVSTRETTELALPCEGLLSCDMCYINDRCPAFKAGNKCTLNFKTQIETPDEFKGAVLGVLQRQMERLNRALFFEKMDGGVANPATSEEMRLTMELIEKFKNIATDQDEISIKARGKSAGVISKLFGDLDGS